MAKKSSRGITYNYLIGLFSFLALFIAGVGYLIKAIDGSLGIVSQIGNVLLVLAVAMASFKFICASFRGKTKTVLQVLCVVFALLALICNFL